MTLKSMAFTNLFRSFMTMCGFVLLIGLFGHAAAAGNPLGASQPLDMSIFIPNAPEWINNTQTALKDAKITEWTSRAAVILISIFFMMALINAFIARTTGQLLRQFVFSLLALGLISELSNGGGILAPAYQAPMNLWIKSYTASNDRISEPLKKDVVDGTRNLAISVHNFFLNASMGLTVISTMDMQRSQILENARKSTAGGTDEDPNALLGAQTLKTAKDLAKEQTDAMKKATGIFQIGYVLLLSFFMAYAGIIYLSAITLILGMCLLPLGLAFWTTGSSTALQYIAIGILGSVMTVVVTPPIMALAARTALHQPTVYLKSMIDLNNDDAKGVIDDYLKQTSKCANVEMVVAGVLDVSSMAQNGCVVQNTALPMVSEFGRVVFKILLGLAIMIITLVVTIGIGVTVMNKVPQLIQAAFGGAFGGGSAPMGGGARGALGAVGAVGGAVAAAGRSLTKGGVNTMKGSVRAAQAADRGIANAGTNARLAGNSAKSVANSARAGANAIQNAGQSSATNAKGALNTASAAVQNRQMAAIRAQSINSAQDRMAAQSQARTAAGNAAGAAASSPMGSTRNNASSQGVNASIPGPVGRATAPGANGMNKANAASGAKGAAMGGAGGGASGGAGAGAGGGASGGKGGAAANSAQAAGQAAGAAMNSAKGAGAAALNAGGRAASAGSSAGSKANSTGAMKNPSPNATKAEQRPYQAKHTTPAQQLKEMKKNGQLATSGNAEKIAQTRAKQQSDYGEKKAQTDSRKTELAKERAALQAKLKTKAS